MSDDSYRGYLAETFGVSSTTQLSEAQFRVAFRDFRLRWPFAKKARSKPSAPRTAPTRAAEPWRGR